MSVFYSYETYIVVIIHLFHKVLYCSSKPSWRFLCLKGLNGNENSDGNSCYRKSFLNTAN